MNHIPRFFLYNRRKNQMNNRKLDRRLALKKNIDYEPPPPPPSSSNSDTCHSLRTQSLDLPPSSFRIQGIDDGEFDLICQTLGLSGPDDFGIPVAAWEARKTRSVSDLLPRLREEEERENFGEKGVIHLSDRFQDSIRVSNEVINDNINIDRSVNLGHTESCSEISPSIVDNSRSIWRISRDNNKNAANITNIDEINSNQQPFVPPAIIDDTSSILDMNSDDINGNRSVFMDPSNHCSTSGACNKGDVPLIFPQINNGDNNGDAILNKYPNIGSIGGIKGVRPPILAPPPSVSTRIIDNTSSTWDIMRSFAPESDKTPSSERERGSYSDEEEDREVRPRGSTAFLSESCSFTTTSNDDDSSSTTTEPMSNISPNGRFKRVITYWEKGELLGRGSFGSVYEGIADGGYFIAVKEVSLLDQGDMGRQSIYQLEQEIALLSQFEHENIVQYYGTDKDDAHLYIFLELVTKGSLLSLYQKYHLRDSQVSSYTRQILHGLKYLHERNVVHRDIKCANILVGADGSVKLADFGLAKATKLNDVKSCKGTAFWMAPEVVRGRHQGYGLPADIWSLGCTVLEMLTHRIPYSPLECMQALFRIGRGEPPPIPDSLSRDARDFISRCLKVDPNDRPTATQLLDHQFVKRPLSTSSGSLSPYHSSGPGLNPFSR